MRIVVFGATGNIGRQIVREAIRRGHQVTGVVRGATQEEVVFDPRYRLVEGDATDPESVASVARAADAVVSAISPRPGKHGHPAPSLADAARALIKGVRNAGVKRLLFVGGAGTLEAAPGVALMDTPDFPEAWKGEAREGRDSLQVFRAEEKGRLDWTYISPAAFIQAGKRTGSYRTTDETLLTDSNGNSTISYEDFAVAVVDELEQQRHAGKRFGAAY